VILRHYFFTFSSLFGSTGDCSPFLGLRQLHGFGGMVLPSLSFIVWSGRPFLGAFVGDFSPSSTRRRMASERDAVAFFVAQRSISLVRSDGSRTAETGS
jgi:hypothetical protein